MGTTVYRVTAGFLAVVIVALGCALTVVLYNAGDIAVQLLYPPGNSYADENDIIRRRMPTDDVYGEAIMKAWIAGIAMMVPGVTGILGSLFYMKWALVVHTLFCVISLIVGSVLFAGGAVGIVATYFLLLWAESYNVFRDCSFIRDDVAIPYAYINESCVNGKKTMLYCIAAVALSFIAWIFILSDLLYRSFTSHNIDLHNRKRPFDPERPRMETSIDNATSTTENPSTTSTNVRQRVKPQETAAVQSGPQIIPEPRAGPSGIYPIAALEELRDQPTTSSTHLTSFQTAGNANDTSGIHDDTMKVSSAKGSVTDNEKKDVVSTVDGNTLMMADNPCFEPITDETEQHSGFSSQI